MKIFVKDFCETVQARVAIFGMQVDNDVLYCGIANQPSPAYSSLYLSDFLSFHTLNDEIFVKYFSETAQTRVGIFGMQVDNDVLYHWIVNQPFPAYSFLYLSIFLSYYIFRQRYLHNCIGYKLQIWYTGSQRQIVTWDGKTTFSYLFFPVFFFYSTFFVKDTSHML